ncbi:MAG: alpha/beta fold hydrolase [Flavobacteriaceae bacterium]|nr:alpha/beta fold hydrolase [Flavobacteriaceae bacterium]
MNAPLNYIKRPSKLTENAPLLIMLHGYGSDENDLFSFSSELPEELFIISLQAPYQMNPYGNAWYAINFDADQNKWNDNEQARESRDKVSEFIDYAVKKYPVYQDNVTLLGFSQGTILSYGVALCYPDKVKNIVAISGYVNEEIIPKDLKNHDYTHLDFFCSHGSVDQVIPVDWARVVPKFLSALNISHVYKEYPVGHGVSPENFWDLKKWLLDRI